MPFEWTSILPYWDATKVAYSSFQTYLQNSEILGIIADNLKSSQKLSVRERYDLHKDFLRNQHLREGIVRMRNETEIRKLLDYHNSAKLPYARVAEDVAATYTAQKLRRHPDYLQGELFTRVGQQGLELQKITSLLVALKTNHESLELHRHYLTYANHALLRAKTDPYGASADFVAETVKGRGVKRFSVSVESGNYEIEYQPPKMNISARGDAARKMDQMMQDHAAGRLFHCVLESSDDFTFKVIEYGETTRISEEKPDRLEFYTAPLKTKRQLVYRMHDTSFTAETEIEIDRVHGFTTIRPVKVEDGIGFNIIFYEQTKRANVTIDMKLVENRPQASSLPLLRFLAAMDLQGTIYIYDSETDTQVWSFGIGQLAPAAELEDISAYADFVRDFLEADHWLRVQGISDAPLEWPLNSSNEVSTQDLLKRIVRVLKDSEHVGYMRASSKFHDISDAARDIELSNGAIMGQLIYVTNPVLLNGKHICDQRVVFVEPEVIAWKDGVPVEGRTFGEMFDKHSGPIRVQFSHEEASTAFIKSRQSPEVTVHTME